MRRLLIGVACVALTAACKGSPSGPGSVSVTQTTTSIAPPTKAAFEVSPSNPRADQSVFFNAASSLATLGQTISKYDWVFGDGEVGTNLTVSHAFKNEGTFNVTLTVTDSAGQKATLAQAVPVVGRVTSTTTTSIPTAAGVRYANSLAAINLPADMFLSFTLKSGTTNTYDVTGSYLTRNGVTGRVNGTMTSGSLTPFVSGVFSGTLSADSCGAVTRTYGGQISQVLLDWSLPTGAPSSSCSDLSFSSFILFKSDATALGAAGAMADLARAGATAGR